MEDVHYIYSKPCGFQRVASRKQSVFEDAGVRHFKKSEQPKEFNYDVLAFLKGEKTVHELPEFVGPIKIQEVKDRGRGIIATDEIYPGELLIVSKALATVYPDPTSNSRLAREVKKLGVLRESIANLIKENPKSKLQVYDLYAGPELGYLCPEECEMADVDMNRIERICSFNGFQGNLEIGAGGTSFGLFYIPSFLNHDCLKANARWNIYQNYMFVRAITRIHKDDEVLINYVDPNESSVFRRNFFLKHCFICKCTLCELERGEGQSVRRRRDIVLQDFKDDVLAEKITRDSINSTIEELHSLRPEFLDLNIFLIQPFIELGFSHYEKTEYEEAANTFASAYFLCALSAQLSLLCVSCAFTIATSLFRIGKKEKAREWVEKAKEQAINNYGTTEVIKVIRPSFYKEMKQNGLI